MADMTRMTDAQFKTDAELLSDLYEMAPCGYHSLGPDGTFLKINTTELRWLGYCNEELVGLRKFTEFLTQEGAANFAQNYPLLIKHGRIDDLRFDLVCRDGSLLPVLISETAIYDESGRYRMSCSVVLDLREHLRIESQFNAAEACYRAVVEDQTEVISRILADGTLIFANDVYVRFFGRSKEELLGSKWHPVAHPDDVQRIESELSALTPDHPVVVIENRVFSGTGEVRWMQFVNRAFFEADGCLREIQSVGRDITEHQQTKEVLQRTLARFRLLADANLVGIVIANAKGEILEANDYYLDILGRSRADLVAGQISWKNVTPPEWLEADYENLANLAAHGVSPPYEKEYVRDDGSRRAIYLANAMLPDDDGRILAVVIDITERKREQNLLSQAKQAAQQANEAKSKFLATISHDLKQPLVALRLYAEILHARPAPENAALAADILNCVASMNDYVNELFVLATLQMAERQVALQDFDVIELLERIISGHMAEARRKHLSLRYRRLPLTARTDPVLFSRLIGNLVTNAIRYTDAGGVLIGCRRYQGKYWVEIWDTGIGIPAGQIKEIFEIFRQLDNGNTRGKQGSGLGLSIVDQIAQLLGLALRVHSREGCGTLFAIELPLAAA
ncbi:MAG: PAS domain-containing sensor histidine kinase [Azoarcus sp.]|nr:PAS domain-containing sensor histidine kinase [Azoarcus sp.]